VESSIIAHLTCV